MGDLDLLLSLEADLEFLLLGVTLCLFAWYSDGDFSLDCSLCLEHLLWGADLALCNAFEFLVK